MGRIPAFLAGVAVTSVIAVAAGFAFYHYDGQHFGSATVAADRPLPGNIEFTDLAGQTHTLEQWRGKLLLVNFWATWCGPCRKEIPYLAQAQKRFAARGLQIIGPAVDDPNTVRQEKGVLGIDYPVMVGTPEAMMSLMAALGNERGGIPFSILIAPDGRVIERHLGEFDPKDLQTLIEHNLPS